jgi:hypothetical protein
MKAEVFTTPLKYRVFIKELYDWRHPLKKAWLEKKNKMFYYTRKTQEFHVGYMTTRHTVLSLSININNSMQQYQQQTLKCCDLERALGGGTPGV